ncbi:tyrosine-type recombinase/integrase [Tsuneonella sp. HG222]
MPRPNTGPRLKWIEARGVYYILEYERGAKRVRSTGTADQREAEAVLAAHIGDRHRDRAGPREPGEVTVADALAFYAEERAPMTADPHRISYAIDALLPFFGEIRLGQINQAMCERYGKQRAKKPGTVRKELGTLSTAINFMHKAGKLTTPVAVTLPAKPESKDRWLTQAEAARLLSAARNAPKARSYLPLFILIALYSGARKEAILSLRWPQVDLERGRIDFQGERERTKKGRAHIPIPDKLARFLRYAWNRRSSDTGTVLHIDGAPIKRVDKGFRDAVKRAGLSGVSPHTLRHTCGTWLAQKGVDLHQIGGWLGHTDARTTEIYRHHSPDFMEEARRAANRGRK